ncbi:DUF3862 domain-containing protein [Companilactobacillus alimentarius]|uniref:DUF3862 domain-containing protein n=1 Tax=Companilactobacillus alimentarius TaxID=1602 RepID=UPI0028BB6FC6|nr:DUF3862 domain-containing protein [Companilactobacillus alimentarius]MDT6951595.1 DUF3862 domain-containing protein [Companilactobacillus alimentarius]
MDNHKYPSRAEYRKIHHLKPIRKPFYQKWWFWLIIVILIIGGLIGGLTGYYYNPGNETAKTTQSSKKKPEKKKTTKKVTGITLKQYNGTYISEKDGMSLNNLIKFFGKPTTSTTSKVDGVQTKIETWTKIANGNKNSKLIIHFYNDHAVTKALIGLKVSRSKKISLAQYQQIKTGQTTENIIKKLGKPNDYSESSVNGMQMKVLKYTSGLNGDEGATLSVNIANDKVSSKSQTGLK